MKPNVKKYKNQKGFENLLKFIAIIELGLITSFQTPTSTFKFLALILMDVYLIWHLFSSKYLLSQIKRSKELKQLFILIAVFVVILIVSLTKTHVLAVGLFGLGGRNLGFLNFFSLVIFLLYLSIREINYQMVYRLYRSGIFLISIFDVLGILQHINRDPLSLTKTAGYSDVILTVGNPNFAGAVMGLLIVGSAAVLIMDIPKKLKIYVLVQFPISVLVLFYTRALQGKMVALLGISVLFYYFLRERKRNLARFILFLQSVFFLFTIFGIFNIGPLRKFLHKSSVIDRIYDWKAAIGMFKAHPFFGVGLDNYNNYFMEFRDKNYPLIYGYRQSVNNAHNMILQLLATGGIFLTLSFLSLILFVTWRSIKLLRSLSGNELIAFAGLFAIWLGYLAQGMVSPDTPATWILGWTCGGILTAKSIKISDKSRENLEEFNFSFVSILSLFLAILVSIITLIYPYALYQTKLNLFLRYTNPADPTLQLSYRKVARETFSLRFMDPEDRANIIKKVAENNYPIETTDFLKQALRQDPRNYNSNVIAALVYNDLSNPKESIKYGEILRKLDPYGAENLYLLAQNYIKVKDLVKAKEALNSINSMAPNTDVAIRAQALLTKNF